MQESAELLQMAKLEDRSKEQYIMAELYLWLLSGKNTSFF